MNRKYELEVERKSNHGKKNLMGSFAFAFASFAAVIAIDTLLGSAKENNGYLFIAFLGLFIIFFAIWKKFKEIDNQYVEELNKLQKEFYESIPADTYRRVDLGFYSKNNPGAFEAFLASCRFYAKRRKNDIVVLMVESTKGDIILDGMIFSRFDIEFENVYEEEWLPDEKPETTE